jgi:hypothetical protein
MGRALRPIPQELFFLWDGPKNPSYLFLQEVQSNKIAKSRGFLTAITQFFKWQEAPNALATSLLGTTEGRFGY